MDVFAGGYRRGEILLYQSKTVTVVGPPARKALSAVSVAVKSDDGRMMDARIVELQRPDFTDVAALGQCPKAEGPTPPAQALLTPLEPAVARKTSGLTPRMAIKRDNAWMARKKDDGWIHVAVVAQDPQPEPELPVSPRRPQTGLPAVPGIEPQPEAPSPRKRGEGPQMRTRPKELPVNPVPLFNLQGRPQGPRAATQTFRFSPRSRGGDSEDEIKSLGQKLNTLLSVKAPTAGDGSEGSEGHAELRAQFQQCWLKIAKELDASLDFSSMRSLCQEIVQSFGIPLTAFGNLRDTFQRFDFNGDGSLEFKEAYRCVKRCLAEYRKSIGTDAAPNVEFRTPDESGYTRIRVLAAGGQGEAILVRDRKGEQVVLKTYSRANQNAGGLEELLQEASAMREVTKCVNVATCIDIFQDKKFLYMISGANFGGDWTALKKNAAQQRVVTDEAWHRGLFAQALNGLAHLHRNAIMHCDIKEPNLMIRNNDFKQPEVVIIDLGLNRALFQKCDGGPSGTPGYIPPETWKDGKWFPRGDIFSMGVTFFQVLTDLVPDQKENRAGIFTTGCRTMEQVIRLTTTREPPWQEVRSKLGPTGLTSIKNWLGLCLAKEMMKRPRVPRVLADPWFSAR